MKKTIESTTLYPKLTNSELEYLISKRNPIEVSRIFSQLNDQRIRNLISSASSETLEKIFFKLSQNKINDLIATASNQNIKRILNLTSEETKRHIFLNLSPTQKNKIVKLLPANSKILWKELLEEDKEINDEYKTILSSRIENSIEKDALDRIKELERQAHLRQEQYDSRHRQAEEKLQILQKEIENSEKILEDQLQRSKIEEEKIKEKERDLQDQLKKLKDEHEKQIQARIEIKVPEYVANAISALETKETEYKEQAIEWSKKGLLALKLAVGGALIALFYGAYEFNSTAKQDISWLFFGYLMLKGLIVVGLFAAWAKHAFNQANAYMHEALKRTERVHAIRFGKLYLEIYGNDVNKQDMKSIFENWNMESHSAFKEIQQVDFQPKLLEKMHDIAELIKASKSELEKNKP